MSRFSATITLTTKNITKEEAIELLDKIVHCDLEKYLEDKIDTFKYSDNWGNPTIKEIKQRRKRK